MTLANLKAEQRYQLILELGILIQPFVDLSKSTIPPELSKYRIACAKVQAGDGAWRQTAHAVCTIASDIFMNVEFQILSHVNELFLRKMSKHINDAEQSRELDVLQSNCCKELITLKDDFYKHLSTIPVDWEPEIFPANTPFTAYLKIKESMALVNERIHYLTGISNQNSLKHFYGI